MSSPYVEAARRQAPPESGSSPPRSADEAGEPDVRASPDGRWLWLPLGTLLVGLLLTALLAFGAAAQYRSNENRLLKLRVRDAGSLLTAAIPDVQSSLASAAELAAATNGNVQRFRAFVMPLVGTGAGHQFVSASLWRLSRAQRGPLTIVGVTPKLAAGSTASAFLAAAARSPGLGVIGLLQRPDPRLGFAFGYAGSSGGFIAYGESALPSNRRSPIQSSSSFAGLNYALYLGSSRRPQELLLSSVSHLPLAGRHAAETVPFGNSALTLVMSPRQPLSGTLAHNLPWIIAIAGVLITLAFAAAAATVTRRRRDAERLAGENRRLYSEQRGIAQTLQHALLPDRLPDIAGVQTSAVYRPGAIEADIGGDWYDVIALEDQRVLVVVGDVCGRGLRAATTMASLRFAIRGYAAQDDPPATILTKLSDLINISEDGQLATVLCALFDVRRHEITVASAGHLPPLLITDGHGEYLHSEVGLPVGVEVGASYATTTVLAPPSATFLAYTDGLVELRDEPIDDGLTRLRDAALASDSDLPDLLHELVDGLRHEPSADDIAILGLRWRN
jgi:serine phosphatase RsbU (regulator of sigma subunit)